MFKKTINVTSSPHGNARKYCQRGDLNSHVKQRHCFGISLLWRRSDYYRSRQLARTETTQKQKMSRKADETPKKIENTENGDRLERRLETKAIDLRHSGPLFCLFLGHHREGGNGLESRHGLGTGGYQATEPSALLHLDALLQLFRSPLHLVEHCGHGLPDPSAFPRVRSVGVALPVGHGSSRVMDGAEVILVNVVVMMMVVQRTRDLGSLGILMSRCRLFRSLTGRRLIFQLNKCKHALLPNKT